MPFTTSRRPVLHLLLFLLIILLAGALRLADLGEWPAGLFRDEAEKGYNAWALATSSGAVDFTGDPAVQPPIAWRPLPWMINVMGGKTSAIYQYASVPIMWLGGLSVFTTRLASALVGTLTVLLLGLLAWRAWGAWPGLAVALWLALSPWHLNFSRWALEGIFVPGFVTLTLLGALGLERGRRWGAPLAGAALGWLFYAYSGAQPFVLAWGACLAAIYCRRLNPKSWPLWLGLALFLVPVIPTLIVRLAPGGSSRLAAVAIWGEPNVTPLQVAGRFIANYFAHFDPRFLFFRGDLLPRHNVTGHGELLIVDLILLPIGLWAASRQRLPLRWALLAAFLCGPLPAAITREGIPHALRSFAMVVPCACWAGIGLVTACRELIARTQNPDEPPARAQTYAAVLVAACLALGVNEDWFQYRRAAAMEPAVHVAFEAGERESWTQLRKEWQPGQRVFINGNIPYAPYYQAFFFRLDPRSLPHQGLESGGFIYFDPSQVTPPLAFQKMRPGDWLIWGVPAAAFRFPDGHALLSEDEARRVHEAWVWIVQKPTH